MYSVSLGLLGMTVYSAGVIFQKKGIGWMKWRGKKNAAFLASLGTWIFGILLAYVISALPTAAASLELPPHVVSSFTGWSIIAAVFFSQLLLKEKLYKSDIFYSCVIVACIILINVFSDFSAGTEIKTGSLYALLLAPFVLLVPVAFKKTGARSKVMLLAVFSGIMSGLTLVFMNVLMKESTGGIAAIAASPYIYIYFFIGIVSGIALQMAFRLGDVILVMPLQTSLTIVYPVVCTYFLFGAGINLPQLAAILLIAFSCSEILRKR